MAGLFQEEILGPLNSMRQQPFQTWKKSPRTVYHIKPQTADEYEGLTLTP